MILSKCQTIDTTCIEYVHPWSNSCVLASLSLLAPCIKESLRIYIAAYSVRIFVFLDGLDLMFTTNITHNYIYFF